MTSMTPSASLLTLLRCFDRDDVSSLQLVSGEVATATRSTGTVPLTQVALTVGQVEHLMLGTPIADVLAQSHGGQAILEVAIAERPLRVAVSRREGQVHIRIARHRVQPSDENPRHTQNREAKAHLPAAHPGITLQPAAPTSLVGQALPAPEVSAPATPRRPGIELSFKEPPPHPMVAPVGGASAPVQASPPKEPLRAATQNMQVGQSFELMHTATGPLERPSRVLQHAEAVTHLDSLVQLARDALASDLHLIADEPPRVRISGELKPLPGPPLEAHALEVMGQNLLDETERGLLQSRGYVDLAVALVAAGRVRANIARHPKGLKICLRLIAEEIPTLASLRLPADLAAVTHYHQGLAVVSGPSGHGKTATLAALIDLINRQSAHHIILIEDPIEVVHPVHQALISQRQVGRDTRSYARALKAALREDPDVIVIGELRDRETVEIALSAAETGHLVLATMNTRSAGKTIDRLIDLFPPEDQAQVRNTLAGSLRMVISQRLLPCIQGGQVPAVELLTGNVPLWALIRDNKLFQLPSLQQRGRSAGMIRLDSSLLDLVRGGQVTAQDARRYAENSVEFERQLQVAGPPAALGH
jgi:twitching motility protein PilT